MPQIAPNLTAPTAMPFVRRHLKHAGVGLFCLAVLFGSVFLYSRHNDFSSFFHPDEPSKAVQILRNTRTYLHPQLMLEATELALKLSGKAPELTVTGRREVTVTGRWVSALFAGLTVVSLGLAGYRYGGFGGLLLSAFAVGLCPSLLLYAHYMKEDTALVFGIALTLLASLVYSTASLRDSRVVAPLFLGVAAGIAASGKYIGIIALAAALVLVSFPRPSCAFSSRWVGVLVGFTVTAALINYRIFADWSGFCQGLTYELNHCITRHFGGTTMNRPNLFFAKALIRETMPHILLLGAVFLISLALFWRRTSRWDLFLVLFAGFFGLVLSFSIIPEYRYNLPIIVILHLMAALAVVRLAMAFTAPRNWIVVVLALIVMIPPQLRRCTTYLDQFANDSRVRLRSFIAHNVLPGSVVLADGYALLRYDDDPRLAENERTLPITLQSKFWVADCGDLHSLPLLGVNYIAVSERAYGRFFEPEVRAAPNDWHYEFRRRFYEQLFAEGELIWSSTPDPPTYSFVNPALRLYRLRERTESIEN